MRVLATGILLISFFLTSGCVGVSSLSKNHKIKNERGTGVVIASVVFTSSPLSKVKGELEQAALPFRDKSKTWEQTRAERAIETDDTRLHLKNALFAQNSFWSPSDFKKGFGKLLVFELEEGDYTIDHWESQISSNLTIYGEIFPIDFSVKSGEVTYIGQMEMAAIFKDGLFRKMAQEIFVVQTDQSARDITMFREKYPHLQESLINLDLRMERRNTSPLLEELMKRRKLQEQNNNQTERGSKNVY